ELGLEHKKDIETFGIAKFNRIAEDSVLRYANDWKRIIPRIGRWVDMESDYKTMDWTYTESVWWIFKTLYDKGLIYEGYKSMHLCPRCETTLANFEVSQGYKDIKDISVTVKFELEDEPGISEQSPSSHEATKDKLRTYVLAWTTTPWTLPGNVALAVNPDIAYIRVTNKEPRSVESYILAKDRFSELEGDFEIVEEFLGSELVGKKYKPLFDYYVSDESLKNRENGWKIYAADFVTTGEGTGIVHIAPAFGEEDMALAKKENLPFIQHVLVNGTFAAQVTDFAGLPVKPKQDHQKTDIEILKYLDAHELLFKKETVTHSYPHCWRCDTPLLNYAANSWFVHVPKIREELIRANKEITWIPAHLKEGRFGKGLETAPDWAISRTRYWGAPLPVWKCLDCKEIFVAGSLADLEARRMHKANAFYILRHGEREDLPHEKDNPKDYDPIVISSRPDVPVHLSERGRNDIQTLAEKLKKEGGVDAIYSSNFIRTKETAEIIGKELGIRVTYDERLWELNHGVQFEGRTVAEYQAFFASPEERFTKKPEGGETLEDVRRRVMSFIREADAKNEGKKILIISHGDPLWMLEGTLQNLSQKEIIAFREHGYIKQGELRTTELKNVPYDEDGRLNFHKPYIDEVVLKCGCGGTMKRIPEVFDCWFESGSMPYGQRHYMGKPLEGFDPTADAREGLALRNSKSEGGFPADFIAEGIDMTRGWFYSLHVLAVALFGKPAFRHVLVNGTVLAEDGQKMSKRLKNYPDPMEMVEKYGADALRLYLLSSPAVLAQDLNFSEKGVDEVSKKIIGRLANVYSFYELYNTGTVSRPDFREHAHALDKFIIYEFSQTAGKIGHALEAYELSTAARAMSEFADVLSTVYLQYSRDRFKEGAERRDEALAYFRYVLVEFAKVVAPLAPFLAESLYAKVKYDDARESVHLEDWLSLPVLPQNYKESWQSMGVVRSVVENILAARSAAGIPVRQPLGRARVFDLPDKEEYRAIIRDRVNIEVVEKDTSLAVEDGAWIDTNITPELREKGMLRAFVRGVQDARKNEGLKPQDRIVLHVHGVDFPNDFFERNKNEITSAVHADELIMVSERGEYKIVLDKHDVFVSIIHKS
ncbi:MAG: isoleucyl-tRNA synthetase, partial [Parcubacteria group bacterium Gr01-1014_29]